MSPRPRWTPSGVLAAALFVVLVAASAVSTGTYLFGRTLTDVGSLGLPALPSPPGAAEEVLLAVGDIASCERNADEAVAALARALPGTIALLGDIVYPSGTLETYRDCLEPAWGPMRERLRPALGNHDYADGSTDGYFAWFGVAAGEPGQGWYSYRLGSWHVVVLNSMCEEVDCGLASEQGAWLAADLAAHGSDPSECLLAYWHHPPMGSGRHGTDDAMRPLWDALVEAGMDVALHGHDHSYERLLVAGVQSFVVGTGGRSLYRFERKPLPQTQARHDGSYGLLHLLLRDSGYAWQFLPLGDTTFRDAGSGAC